MIAMNEFSKYSTVSEMPESVKKSFWAYVDALDKKLDSYYKVIRSKKEPQNLDKECTEFIRFIKNIPDIANARLYQKQKRCVGELLKHYEKAGRKTPASLLSALKKSFATDYR